MDDNTKIIAEQIFTKPPGDPHTIDLSLDDSTIDFVNNNKINFKKLIIEIVTMITLYFIEILFGHNNLLLLKDDDIILIKRYERSYGYDLRYYLEDEKLYVSFKKLIKLI